jgi:hypothetical protein
MQHASEADADFVDCGVPCCGECIVGGGVVGVFGGVGVGGIGAKGGGVVGGVIGGAVRSGVRGGGGSVVGVGIDFGGD